MKTVTTTTPGETLGAGRPNRRARPAPAATRLFTKLPGREAALRPNKEIFPLRRKTVDVMKVKGLSPVTREHCLREIAMFDRHTGHLSRRLAPPATLEDRIVAQAAGPPTGGSRDRGACPPARPGADVSPAKRISTSDREEPSEFLDGKDSRFPCTCEPITC